MSKIPITITFRVAKFWLLTYDSKAFLVNKTENTFSLKARAKLTVTEKS